jgi:hypothetical protein
MDRIISLIRVRVLERTMRLLGQAVEACTTGLLQTGMDAPAIFVLFNGGDATVQHPDTATERLLVLQLLERPAPRSHTELRDALADIEPWAINLALKELEFEDVLYIGRDHVWASDTVRHLDKLGLIAL